MYRRVAAWLALIGFIFLIMNLLVFRFQPALSAYVYMGIVLLFVLYTKWFPKEDKGTEKQDGDTNRIDS